MWHTTPLQLPSDLSKLAASWPEVDAFQIVNGVLDLRPLWVAHGLKQRAEVGSPTVSRAS